MKEIKFTMYYEPALSFSDKNFKKKYEERISKNQNFIQKIDGDAKHLALCPRCNNPVAILGIYKKIDVAPHARHVKNVNIPDVVQFDEYKYLNCPYHKKKANYVKEYVPETEEPQRQEIYKITKDHYDKAIYLLQKETGIYITLAMAEALAENYVSFRVYNYIDATVYNIPWYLIYSYNGFLLDRLFVKKGGPIFKHIKKLGLAVEESKIPGYVYVKDRDGHVLIATNYRYAVDKNDTINEWLDFSITRPDDKIVETLLYNAVDRFSIKVDSYHFENLINYSKWETKQNLLKIANDYMNPSTTVIPQKSSLEICED